jgi:hypothetical protein
LHASFTTYSRDRLDQRPPSIRDASTDVATILRASDSLDAPRDAFCRRHGGASSFDQRQTAEPGAHPQLSDARHIDADR